MKTDTGDKEYKSGYTDVFIFNDDELRRIDAYQRVEGTAFKAASRVGDKILVAISNAAVEPDEWRRIGSYEGLMEEISYLEDEDPENPVMSGETAILAGSGVTYELEMDRIMSKILIRTLCADFNTAEFEGEPFTDVKLYLTNVSASCAIMRREDFRPETVVNAGSLDTAALSGFRTADMLRRDVPFNLTVSASPADIALYCYPNDSEEETVGSPFTRLVIEGKIRGITCYYPIPINREENGVCFGSDGSGIGRNREYDFDITLCRFGTDDPDTVVRKGDVRISCTVEPWTVMDSQTIIY